MWIIWLIIFVLVVIGQILQNYHGSKHAQQPPPSDLFSVAADLIDAYPEFIDFGVEDLISSLPTFFDLGAADLLLGVAV